MAEKLPQENFKSELTNFTEEKTQTGLNLCPERTESRISDTGA